MKIYVRGQGEVRLSAKDFVAEGGQARVYAKGKIAFKLFRRRDEVPQPRKIEELSRIRHPSVLAPHQLVIDPADGGALGYTMSYARAAYSLCQLFTRSFRQRHHLNRTALLVLLAALRDTIEAVHAAGCLLVDLSGTNVLTAPPFRDVLAIDTDSYATPSYGATAISPVVRDPLIDNNAFRIESDWFSFAVLAFQLLVGVHPYRGRHPNIPSLDERMRRHLSAFDAAVTLPPSAESMDDLPGALRDWLYATLQRGERVPPPVDLTANSRSPRRGQLRHGTRNAAMHSSATSHSSATMHSSATAHSSAAAPVAMHGHTAAHSSTSAGASLRVDAQLLDRCGSEIISLVSGGGWRWAICADGIYRNGKRIAAVPRSSAGVQLALSIPGAHPVAAWLAHDGHRLSSPSKPALGALRLSDVTRRVGLQAPSDAEAVATCAGRLYAKSGEQLVEISLRDVGGTTLAASRVAGTLHAHTARLYDGVVLQRMLGASYALCLGGSHATQRRLSELDGERVLDARYREGVLAVLLAAGARYRRLLFRFAAEGERYDVLDDRSDEALSLELVTLARGVAVLLENDGTVRAMSSAPGDGRERVMKLPDELLNTAPAGPRGARLVQGQDGVLCIFGESVYRITTPPAQRRGTMTDGAQHPTHQAQTHGQH